MIYYYCPKCNYESFELKCLKVHFKTIKCKSDLDPKKYTKTEVLTGDDKRCTKCFKIRKFEDYSIKSNGELYNQCKKCRKSDNNHNQSDKAKENEKIAKINYVEQNPEKRKESVKKYDEKASKDPEKKLIKLMRGRIHKAFKSSGTKKSKHSIELLGSSIDFAKSWMEFQFDDKMNWKNMGKYWEIDHIKPCSSYDLQQEDEQFDCFGWRNLRPLEARENNVKGDKIQLDLINKYKNLADCFELLQIQRN